MLTLKKITYTDNREKGHIGTAVYSRLGNGYVFADIGDNEKITGTVNGVSRIIECIIERENISPKDFGSCTFSSIIIPGGYTPEYRRPGPFLLEIQIKHDRISWGEQQILQGEIEESFQQYLPQQ